MGKQGRRLVSERAADVAALRAIAQAAVNVELFTLPLYMVALYSIQGMHQITGKGNAFYEGRLWPGAATTANPRTANEEAFNLIFSIFIEEMLHLQLAANIASAIGVTPTFSSPALQNDSRGWTCYGPLKTIIPHVMDLRDTITHSDLAVNTGGLSAAQVELFLTIEESAAQARVNIRESSRDKYFPSVPFQGWAADNTEEDLPLFGTIDHLYQCYFDYMTLEYTDGKSLWEHVFTAGSIQNDLFNVEETGHPKREFPGFRTTITATGPADALLQTLDMMDAITDQGEGSVLNQRVSAQDLDDVAARYQESEPALVADYPCYGDSGQLTASADAVARVDEESVDHYARFTRLAGMLGEVETWPAWHQRHGPWAAADLQTKPTNDPDPYDLPSTREVADALNRVASSRDVMYPLTSQAAVGSLAGITTVLNEYWAQGGVVFPYPAMVGSGDRVAMCWALFGEAPDLSLGAGAADVDAPQHACQSLDASKANGCAAVAVYHSCRGSNNCRYQGGCGFVQKITEGGTPGGSCGFALVKAKAATDPDGAFSVPSGNKCGTFGGCAVPISASQLLIQGGVMQLYDANGDPFGKMTFEEGEKVHDVAYRAFLTVMGRSASEPPPPTDMRLIFPPST